MPERKQLTWMQVRLARLAARKWGLPLSTVGKIFAEYGVFEHIRDCFGLFHTEGDEAVWDDLQPYLRRRGCPYAKAG